MSASTRARAVVMRAGAGPADDGDEDPHHYGDNPNHNHYLDERQTAAAVDAVTRATHDNSLLNPQPKRSG